MNTVVLDEFELSKHLDTLHSPNTCYQSLLLNNNRCQPYIIVNNAQSCDLLNIRKEDKLSREMTIILNFIMNAAEDSQLIIYVFKQEFYRNNFLHNKIRNLIALGEYSINEKDDFIQLHIIKKIDITQVVISNKWNRI